MTTHAPHHDRAVPDQSPHDLPRLDQPLAGHPLTALDCRDPDDPERLAYLDGLKHQIREGVYRPDIKDLARSLASMLVRNL